MKSVKQTLRQRISIMTKKGSKKNSKESGEESDLEIISGTRIETIFEDTKEIMGIALEFKWRELYHMIRDENIPNAGLEEIVLYHNINRFDFTKAARCLEIFPCSEFLGLILPRGLFPMSKGRPLLHLIHPT